MDVGRFGSRYVERGSQSKMCSRHDFEDFQIVSVRKKRQLTFLNCWSASENTRSLALVCLALASGFVSCSRCS